MSLYDETVPVFVRTLTALEVWIDDAHAFAEERGFSPDVFLTARLAPDQFDVTRNIQSTCDSAKLTCSRVTGVDAPTHEDGPCSWEVLRARIADVKGYLGGLGEEAFAGRDDVVLSPAFLRGGRMLAKDYVRGFGIANFYFHACATYSILRANGVKLGKIKYIGGLTLLPADA